MLKAQADEENDNNVE